MRTLALLGAAACLGLATALVGDDRPVDPEEARIAELVKQLGDDSFAKREAATRALEALGVKAVPALAAAAGSDDLEVRRRARRILQVAMPGSFRSKAIGMSMVRIEVGDFGMGSPPAEAGRRDDEPGHRVHITRPLYLGAYEVTQDEYERVMKLKPSHFSHAGGGSAKIAAGIKTDRFPVENVTWFDAVEFCNRLGRIDGFPAYYKLTAVKRTGDSITDAKVTVAGGRGYRLPSEAEWEYACRAGSTTPFHYGGSTRVPILNVKPILVPSGYGSALAWPDLGRTTAVGGYKPNAWGLYDMHGNVAEWCGDWYDKDYYGVSPASNPPGPAKGVHRVARGGSWLITEASARSACRAGQVPGEKSYTIGFRVGRSP